MLKFGGTSVAGRAQWEAIASLAEARQADGFRVLLVCSAVAGVTDQLNALAYQPASDSRLMELLAAHRRLGRSLDVTEDDWLPESERLLRKCLQKMSHDPGPQARASLLALGEWLSTKIGFAFLRQRLDAAWVDSREALETAEDRDHSPARRWLSASCRVGEAPDLAGRWSASGKVVITQGFVARTPGGGTALLGRGGSDTSAALLAGRLSADRLEIWTDVPGLFSADPRLIAQARLLRRVDYDEALEMAASGATVVHPRCIRAAAVMNTPVLIRDLGRRQAAGTRIEKSPSVQSGVKTVTCQEQMAVLLLQKLDARFQVGFLAEVFDTFRRRGISVDLVATSETTTTVAVNCEANLLGEEELAHLAEDLGARCKVRLFDDCVCVNLVGRGARTALARIPDVMRYFDDHPLLMVSQSANDLCLSLLVNRGEHDALLRGAHQALIPAGGSGPEGVFGESWAQIQQQDGQGNPE